MSSLCGTMYFRYIDEADGSNPVSSGSRHSVMLSVCSTFIGDAMFTPTERVARVTVMVIAIIVVLLDMFVWRPL